MNRHLLPLNILIADDHQIMIDGLQHILEVENIIGELATANDGMTAVQKTLNHSIDLVIMDISMPVLSGLEATKLIKQRKPHVKVIIISMLSDATTVTKVLKGGADAFIIKNTGKNELLNAIDKVMNNEKYVSSELTYNLFSTLSKRSIKNEYEAQLTARELEIIRYIAEGLTNHEIAGKLFLSFRTVDTHRNNILSKLNLKNTAALIKYAAEKGLL